MSNIQESHAARALRVCQEARTGEIWRRVCDILSRHPCVAYGFSIEWREDESDCVWSDSVSISLELLQIATGIREPYDGQLSSNRRSVWAEDQIARGLEAVNECLVLVQSIHIPFTLLVHVPGQPEIGAFFNPRHGNSPSYNALAEDLRFSLEILQQEFEELGLT